MKLEKLQRDFNTSAEKSVCEKQQYEIDQAFGQHSIYSSELSAHCSLQSCRFYFATKNYNIQLAFLLAKTEELIYSYVMSFPCTAERNIIKRWPYNGLNLLVNLEKR